MNSSNIRLIFGLIFLLSIFFFMGTESTGCLDCDKDNNANITITNGTGVALKIVIAGDTSKEFILSAGNSSVSWVEPGQYYITAYDAPFYTQVHFSTTLLLLPSQAEVIVITD